MARKFCDRCGRRPSDSLVGGQHLCDIVVLADGREVHADRVAPGGDLSDEPVTWRQITDEMRNLQRKGFL